jgi:hypothetical protein
MGLEVVRVAPDCFADRSAEVVVVPVASASIEAMRVDQG